MLSFSPYVLKHEFNVRKAIAKYYSYIPDFLT